MLVEGLDSAATRLNVSWQPGGLAEAPAAAEESFLSEELQVLWGQRAQLQG